VGLVSAEPIRLMGLISAFEDHPSIQIHLGDIDALLEDRSLHYLILDVSYDLLWSEMQAKVRKMRPDVRQIILGRRETRNWCCGRLPPADALTWIRTAGLWRCGRRWNR
jgi:hypothetical protein